MSLLFYIFPFLLISLSSSDIAFNYNITLSSPNQYENGTIPLTRGIYTPIRIEIIPVDQDLFNSTTLHLTTTDTARFHIPEGEIILNTKETRLVHTFIGVNCEAVFTPEELEKGLSVGIVDSSSADICHHETQPIILIEQVNEFELVASSRNIPNFGFGVFTLKQSLYFVDPLNIVFEYDETQAPNFGVENPMTIFPHYHPDTYTNIMTRYYFNSSEGIINDLKITAKLQNENLAKCYKIADNSTEFIVSVKKDILPLNVTDKTIPIWFRTESSNDNSVYISSINNKPLINTLLSCVITDNDYSYPEEQAIISQNYSEIHNQLRYFRLFFGDNTTNFKYEFNTLNRYVQYKYKCALENNILNTSSLYSKDFFGSRRSINLIDAIEYKAQCLEFNFSTIQNEAEFAERLQTYALTKLYRNETSFPENSCLNVRYNSFKEYFNEANGQMGLLCIYPAGQCRYLLNKETVDKNIEDVFSILKNQEELKTKLDITSGLEFNSITDIDYPGNTNETMLNVYIQENNKDYMVVDMEMKTSNVRSPFKCEYELNEFKGEDPFYYKFYPEGTPETILFSREHKYHSNIKIPYPEKTENKLHSLNFRCSYFPDIRDLNSSSYTFSYMYIMRNESNYFDCKNEKDKKANVYCLNNKRDKLEFENVHDTPDYIKELSIDVKNFDKVLFVFKQNRMEQTLQNAKKNDEDILILLRYLISFEEYLRKFNCMQSQKGFDTCITKKQELQTQSFEEYREYIRSKNGTYVDYFNTLPPNQVQETYYGIFMLFISILNNMDSIADTQALRLINQLTGYLEPSKNVSSLIQEILKGQDEKIKNFKEDMVLLLSNFTLGYNDLITHCSRKKLIDPDKLNNIYTQFTSQIFENLIANEKYSLSNEKFVFKYESNFGESNKTSITTNNNFTIDIEIPNTEVQSKMEISGYSLVAFNELEGFIKQENLTSLVDFILSIKPFFKNGTLYKDNSLLIENEGKIKLQIDLSSLNNSTFNTCYMFDYNGALDTSHVKSTYDVNKMQLICESDMFGDFVVGIDAGQGGDKKKGSPLLRNVLIGILIAALVIALIVIIVSVLQRKGKKSELDEINDAEEKKADLKLLPSFEV